ncbi:DUF3037 domain-containing protein [Apibacter muscae]|uniref:DUF3037 domain-containing protein n=1 Tax=Apibacter muscae TaxID=2509004 RepID=A0A563D7T9_9FLAO|nr:DUF3037 domain-containing protein [Apibacter muscae]TWP26083.1 DUF3037 domain-containing protein [Apibacter muscae]
MQEKHLYEYAIIRLVPKIEREEFINIGLILFSKHARYINLKYEINERKIKCLFNKMEELDIENIHYILTAFENICKGKSNGGEIGKFDIPERFRWLTAMRSTIIQTSRPHPGISTDLNKTFSALWEELVM